MDGAGRSGENQNNHRELKMIAINKVRNNTELLSKLLNSIARKYNCDAKFSTVSGVLQYEGDEACRQHIIDETLEIISREPGQGPH